MRFQCFYFKFKTKLHQKFENTNKTKSLASLIHVRTPRFGLIRKKHFRFCPSCSEQIGLAIAFQSSFIFPKTQGEKDVWLGYIVQKFEMETPLSISDKFFRITENFFKIFRFIGSESELYESFYHKKIKLCECMVLEMNVKIKI
jgi:hypothetical protein